MKNNRTALKFFIGYFSLIPFAVFVSQKLFFFSVSLFKDIPGLTNTFSVKDLVYSILVFLVYFFIYKRWQSLRLLPWIFVSVFLTDFIFGIAIVFTLPFWIFLPIILIGYGFFTGLFKKEMELFVPDFNSDNPINNQNQTNNLSLENKSIVETVVSKKQKIIRISSLILALYLLFHFVYFGGIIPCVYTYTKVDEPSLSSGEKMILKADTFLVKGGEFDSQSCRWSKGPSFKNNILGSDAFETCLNCRDVFVSQGATISDLPKGKTFSFVGAYDSTKKGITTIDSGSSRMRYWVLKDEKDVEYTFFTLYNKYGKNLIVPIDEYNKLNLIASSTPKINDARIFSAGAKSSFRNGFVGKFTFPAGGESLKYGEKNKISWQMPKDGPYLSRGMSLLDDNGNMAAIKEKSETLSSLTSTDWDFKTLIYPDPNFSVIKPGKYKLTFWYEYPGGDDNGVFESNSFEIVK